MKPHPIHWKDIDKFYLIKYADQLRICNKLEISIKPDTTIEKKILSQNKEFFKYIETLQHRDIADSQAILEYNFYAWQYFQQPTVPEFILKHVLDRAAEFLTFGVTERCEECKKGNMIYENDVYQCRGETHAFIISA